MKNLKQLFESDLLNEETRGVLQEAFNTAIEEKETEIEAKYAERLNEEKIAMTNVAMEMVEEAITDELSAIQDKIVEANTLEIRYAEKLEEFKTRYDEKLQEQMATNIAESVAEELEELKEDIEFAKKHEFVMGMFESFKEVYSKTFGSGDVEAYDQLKEAQEELAALKREKVLNSLLEGLEGSTRNVALTILEGTSTEKLEERFESLRPILLKEHKEDKEDKPLTESQEEEVEGKVVIEEGEEEVKQPTKVDDRLQKRLERSLRLARNV